MSENDIGKKAIFLSLSSSDHSFHFALLLLKLIHKEFFNGTQWAQKSDKTVQFILSFLLRLLNFYFSWHTIDCKESGQWVLKIVDLKQFYCLDQFQDNH